MADLVARRTAHLVLAIDAILGLGWLLTDPRRSSGPVYRPIHDLLAFLPGDPARWWGGVLLLMVAVTLAAMRYASELHARRCFAVITGYWAMWAAAYLWGFFEEPTAALAPFGYSLMAMVGNRRPVVAPQRVSSKAR